MKQAKYANDPLVFWADLLIPTADGAKRLGDCWFDFQREWLTALAAAMLAVATGRKADFRKLFFEGPKGVAKSSMIALSVIWLVAYSRKPLLVQIAASDKEQAGEWWKAAVDILRLNPQLSSLVTQQTLKLLGPQTKTVAETLAADIAGSPGARPQVLFVDEFCNIAKQEFVQNCLDNSAKISNAIVCIFTNAGWKSTYQYEWRCAWQQSAAWKCFGRYEPSPSIDPIDLKESALRNSVARHRRLQYTEWSDESEEGIGSDLIDRSATLPGEAMVLPQGVVCPIGALDLGLRRDWAAFCITGCHVKTRKVILLHARTWKPPAGGEVNIDDVEQHVINAGVRFRLRKTVVDFWQGAQLVQRLNRKGYLAMTVHPTQAYYDYQAVAVLNAFREGTVALYSSGEGARLIAELKRAGIVEKPGPQTSAYRLIFPKGGVDGHCDLAAAFAMALAESLLLLRDVDMHQQIAQAQAIAASNTFGALVGDFPGAIDSPRPDMAVEFPRAGRNRPPQQQPLSLPPISDWRP